MIDLSLDEVLRENGMNAIIQIGLCRSMMSLKQLTLQSNPKQPRPELDGKCLYDVSDGTYSIKKWKKLSGAELVKGYQLRYIYFIDKSYKDKLTVPIIPFSKINELGIGMYKGKKRDDNNG